MGEWAATLVKWLVPPPDHNPKAELAWRWRLAVFGCVSFIGFAAAYYGMAYRGGLPDFIRPASAQEVHEQIEEAKKDVTNSLTVLQANLVKISDAQGDIQKAQRSERLERVEQQLLWYRQQNCKSKGPARNYTWQKMTDLKDKFRELTGSDWLMPTCADIGD